MSSDTPLYVRLPSDTAARLDRASDALGVHKKDLVAGLITKYVDPSTKRGLTLLSDLTSAQPVRGGYTFQAQPNEPPPEVLTVEQAAELLQVELAVVLELAKSGELPGKQLGKTWRFSRVAILAWLAQP